VNNATPVVGDEVVFTLVATNAGPNDVSQAQVNDLLPSGYAFVSATPSQGTYNPTTGVWDIGNLAIGSETTLVIRATVNPTGDYRNLADIEAADAVDPDQTNNFSEATVVPIPQDPRFTLVKNLVSVNGESAITHFSRVGDELTYEITVENTGNVSLTGIEVADPATGLEETIATLLPGGSTSFTTTHTVTDADILGGSFVNIATASGDDPGGEP